MFSLRTAATLLVLAALLSLTARQTYACGWAYHTQMTTLALQNAGFSPENISLAVEGNISADCEELELASAHFCNEAHAEASERLRTKLKAVVENLKSGNKFLALRELGKMTHAMQDFYCHSNFVENDPNGIIDLYNLKDPDPQMKCDPKTFKGPLTTAYWPEDQTPPGKCSHEQLNKDRPTTAAARGNFGLVETRAQKETDNLITKLIETLPQDLFDLLRKNTADDASGSVVLFDWAKNRAVEGFPKSMKATLPELSAIKVETALRFDEQVSFIFEGDHYYAYDMTTKSIQPGYPKKISQGWPGLSFTSGVDAAVRVGEKVYFFRGSQYAKFSLITFRQDSKYPRPIAERWKGVFTEGVDEALRWGNEIYFFKDSNYVRYNITTKSVPKPFPLPVGDAWSGIWMNGVDAALQINENQVYFFRSEPIKPIPSIH